MSSKAIKIKSKREASKIISHIYGSSLSDNSVEKKQKINIIQPNSCSEVHVINEESAFDRSSISDSQSETETESELDFGGENSHCDPLTLKEKLSQWSIKNNICNSVLNELLQILREENISVPKDSRTLKKTPKSVVARSMGDGSYAHYGLKDVLTDFLVVNELNSETIFQVWPILCNILGYSDVYAIGVYEGYSKPGSSNDFLNEFVDELNGLITDGLQFQNKRFTIKIRCFVMDAPARAFVLGIKGHSGYYSCTRCCEKGEMYKNRVVFPNICLLRDDYSFRNRTQPEHHNQQHQMLIEKLPIDMVHQVGLDYMHIICLGVTRTLLKAWIQKKGVHFSLTSWQITDLSSKLINLKNCIPHEFMRKPRSLDDLKRWKATELRQFLLYYGPFLVHSVLSEERYLNFMKLSIATRI
ncbi:uncharacterized protein LOC118750128 [Rhagoletis pomonella]|uniref:uncharacterized protein LOC118750128 n=1 Tax=Rhagoletis pomonella TaxID=28610 RepID=UPI00177EEF76|nr:uncharacterized protein LOC118750128 [Rhagoletis pomonella]